MMLVLAAGAGFAWDAAVIRYARHLRAQDYRTYLSAADQAMKQHDLPRAVGQLGEALRLAPQEPQVHKVTGDVYYGAGKWERAVAAYTKAIELGSPELGARTNMLWALVELGRNDEAVAFGQAALADGFTSPAISRYIAVAYWRAGKHAEAIPHLEEALKGYSNDLYLMDHLRQAYRSTGATEKAEEIEVRIAATENSLNAGARPEK